MKPHQLNCQQQVNIQIRSNTGKYKPHQRNCQQQVNIQIRSNTDKYKTSSAESSTRSKYTNKT